MATRLYIMPGTSTTPTAGSFASSWSGPGVWEYGSADVPTAAASQVNVVKSLSSGTPSGTNMPSFRLIGPALAAQTISGTFKGQVQAHQSGDQNLTIQTVVRVMTSSHGQRGVLYAGDTSPLSATPTSELALTTRTNRRSPRNGPATLTPLAVEQGDYLSIEVGVRFNTTLTSNPYVAMRTEQSTATPLPENETETGTKFVPWWEFSQDLILASTTPKNYKVMIGGVLQDPPLPAGAVARYVMHNGTLQQIQ